MNGKQIKKHIFSPCYSCPPLLLFCITALLLEAVIHKFVITALLSFLPPPRASIPKKRTKYKNAECNLS